MKTNKFLKTALLSVCLMGGVSASWAENVSIPQDLGSYINWETQATKTAGNGTPQSDKTQLGSTNGSTIYTITLNNSTEQNYIMQFASGAKELTAKVSFTLTDGGSYSVKKEFDVSNTGAWTPTEMHYAEFESVPTGTLTLTFKVESTTGSYAGNYGKFALHAHSTYNQWPMQSSNTYLDLSTGTATISSSPRYMANTPPEIGYIKNGYYIDDYYVYNGNATNYYQLCMNTSASNGGGQMKITVTDMLTGTNEVEQTFDATTSGDQNYSMSGSITPGLKKIRFDFIKDDEGENFFLNFKNVTFDTYDEMPLMSVGGVNTYLALNGGTYGRTASAKYDHNPSYESGNDNIGYNGDGGFAEFYVANTNETAYYDFHIGTSRYQDDATFTLTITDVATSTVEVNQSGLVVPDGRSYADQTYKLTNAITPGLKKIRIETASESNSYAFNYKNVTFYKRSLNEAYTYSPVAATGVDVVLTRKITAGNWSTIVLPFAMTAAQLKEAFGDDVKVAALTSGDATTLNFTALDLTNGATTTTANQPYAIKVGTTVDEAKTISGVTIEEGTPIQEVSTNWSFIGNYTKDNSIAASTESASNFFFSGNKIYKATGSIGLQPFRAYFQYAGVAAARQVLFVIEGEEGETSIGRINTDGTMETVAEGPIFNLAGQRVANPSKSLYIVNGKKVIIK
jgi:hypothetical protein